MGPKEGNEAGRREFPDQQGWFQANFKYALVGMTIMDLTMGFQKANAAVCDLLGYTESELCAMRLTDLMFPEDADRQGRVVLDLIDGKLPFVQTERRLCSKDGRELWVVANSCLVKDENGRALYITSQMLDITERKRAETELRKAEEDLLWAQEKLRALANELVAEGEETRRAIARELHDVAAQRLAAIGLRLSALMKIIPSSSRAIRKEVRALGAQVENLIEEFRQFARGLHPSVLQELGILAALQAECNAFSKAYNIRVRFSHDTGYLFLPQNIALSLYRIAQQGLRNVAQHAGAKEVQVMLNTSDGHLCLRIIDNGSGFDPDIARRKKGLGLTSMDERARAVGGRFSISSGPDKGSELTATVPFRSEDETSPDFVGR